METVDLFKKASLYSVFVAGLFFATSCSDDDEVVPTEENEVEVITDVKLIFTNTADTTEKVMATAQDPDGEGAQELLI